MDAIKRWLSAHRVLMGLLALAASVYLLWVTGTPPWRMPDEPAHFSYLEYLSREGSIPLPNQAYYYPDMYESMNRTNFFGVYGAEATNLDPAMALKEVNLASGHPPLYYLLMFPVYKISEGRAMESQVFFIRMAGMGIFLALVALSYRFASLLFPQAAYLQAGIPMLIILHPQFAYISSGVMIDGLQALLFTLFLYQLVCVIRGDFRSWRGALLGAAIGLAMLTKASSVIAYPLAFTALVALFAVRKGERLALLRTAAIALLASLAVYGWYPLRNHLGDGYVQTWQGNGSETKGWWHLWFATNFRAKLLGSFLGSFSWTKYMHENAYFWFRRISELAALGLACSLLIGYLRRGWRVIDAWTAVLFGGAWALFFLAVTYFESIFANAQGRYLFPVIFPFWTLVLVGLTGWLPPAWRPRATALVVLATAGLSAWSMFSEAFPRMI